MFVSNSDNLGATLDLDILSYLASSDKPFLMEVCERTEADKKGGHLAIRKSDGRLILRESAQCSAEDESYFQDVSKHRSSYNISLVTSLQVINCSTQILI